MKLNYNNVAVFCGSQTGNDPVYAQEATILGTGLGKLKAHIIYGGGDIGLMGEFSRAAKAENARITSIIPKAFVKDAKVDRSAHPQNAIHIVETLFERKDRMILESDLVFSLPGGIGTHDENFEILAFNDIQKYLAPDSPIKPLVIIDVNNLFRGMRILLEDSVRAGFLKEQMLSLIHWAQNSKEALRVYDDLRNRPIPVARSLIIP